MREMEKGKVHEEFQEAHGFSRCYGNDSNCYVANGNIVIEGLEHNALLQVFAANGQLLLSRVSDGSDMQLSMPRGLYLVHISKQNRVKTYKVSL